MSSKSLYNSISKRISSHDIDVIVNHVSNTYIFAMLKILSQGIVEISNVYIVSNYEYLFSDVNSDTDGMSNVYHIVCHVYLIMNQVMISIDIMSNSELLNYQISYSKIFLYRC